MSAHLPPISLSEAIAAFKRVGFNVIPSRGKLHIIMARPGDPVHLSIPNHHELKRGLLRSLIRDAKLGVPEFVKLTGR